MDYKEISIESVNRVLGFNIEQKSKDKTVTRARQGAWLCFYINGYSYSDIARIFDCNRKSVSAGVDMFEDLLKQGDKTTLEIWDKLKVYEL